MTAVEDGDFEEGVRQMNRVLAVRGQVVPASPTPLVLHADAPRRDRGRRPVEDRRDERDRAGLADARGGRRVGGRRRRDRRGGPDRDRPGQPVHERPAEPPAARDPGRRRSPRPRRGSTSATWPPSRARRPASTWPTTSRPSSGTPSSGIVDIVLANNRAIGCAGRRVDDGHRSAMRSGCAGRRTSSGHRGSSSTTWSIRTIRTTTTPPGWPPRSSGSPSATAALRRRGGTVARTA